MSVPVTIRALGISRVVAGRAVISGLSVEATAGEMIAVGGPSGSGKTTLLMVLAGLASPTAGTLVMSGLNGDDEIRRTNTGYVFQRFGLIPFLTAAENVALVLRPGRRPASAVVDPALQEVGLAEVRDRLVQDLSGGQQQRVAVARAIAGNPSLIVADEPTSELDTENRERIVGLLRARARGGAIVILSSDDPDVTAKCDRTIQLGR